MISLVLVVKMKSGINIVVLLSVFSLGFGQDCLPCLCSNNSADCSRSTLKRVVGHLPELSRNIERITLEGQPLESINNHSMPFVPKAKMLSLQSCKLSFVHRYTFKYMPELEELDLSCNEIESLDRNIFAYNTKLISVHLNNNKLHIIKQGTFVHQKMLTNLYLQSNLIPDLSKGAFSNYPALKVLNLTQNHLKYIDSEIIQDSEDLLEVYIDDNPFNCDCHLRPFFQALKTRKLTGINSECFTPNPLKGQPLIDLSASDFNCPINLTVLDKNILTHFDNITLSCTIDTFDEPYFSWRFNNNMVFDNAKYQMEMVQQSPMRYQYNLTVFGLNENDSGGYICSASNTGFSNESLCNLTVKPGVEPVILLPNTPFLTVDLHTYNYTIPFKIYGVPKPNVSWIYRDKILHTYTDTTNKSVAVLESYAGEDSYWFNITIRKVKLKYRTEFTCSSFNFKGTTNKTITLRILYPKKIAFESASSYIEAKEKENATLICKVNAVPKPDIIWRYGHLKIDSSISPDKYYNEQYRDYLGTYWNILTIKKLELYEGGIYNCEANNSNEIKTQKFTIFVHKIEDVPCENNWKNTLFIVIGGILIFILLIAIILKCCVRYYVSKNWTQEYSYRGSVLG